MMTRHIAPLKLVLLAALALGVAMGAAYAKGPKSSSNPASDENTPPPPPSSSESDSSSRKSKGAPKAAKDSKEGEGTKKKEDVDKQTLEGKISELSAKELTLKVASRVFSVPGNCAISKGDVKDEAKFEDLKVGDNITVSFTTSDGKDTATQILVKGGKSGDQKAKSSGSKEDSPSKGKKKKSAKTESGSDG
jgi:Cu/Ag efflux protein CusF